MAVVTGCPVPSFLRFSPHYPSHLPLLLSHSSLRHTAPYYPRLSLFPAPAGLSVFVRRSVVVSACFPPPPPPSSLLTVCLPSAPPFPVSHRPPPLLVARSAPEVPTWRSCSPPSTFHAFPPTVPATSCPPPPNLPARFVVFALLAPPSWLSGFLLPCLFPFGFLSTAHIWPPLYPSSHCLVFCPPCVSPPLPPCLFRLHLASWGSPRRALSDFPLGPSGSRWFASLLRFRLLCLASPRSLSPPYPSAVLSLSGLLAAIVDSLGLPRRCSPASCHARLVPCCSLSAFHRPPCLSLLHSDPDASLFQPGWALGFRLVLSGPLLACSALFPPHLPWPRFPFCAPLFGGHGPTSSLAAGSGMCPLCPPSPFVPPCSVCAPFLAPPPAHLGVPCPASASSLT